MTENLVIDSYEYFELLYIINQKLIRLIGVDIIRKRNDSISLTFDIIDDLPKMLPIRKNKKENKYKICSNDGLMNHKNEVVFLWEDYNNILIRNYEVVCKIIRIRNKLEHKMHSVKVKSSSNGTSLPFKIEVMINNESIIIDTNELISIVSMLNELYSKIAHEISRYAENSRIANSFYSDTLIGFDYKDFNELYRSKLINKISRLQQPF